MSWVKTAVSVGGGIVSSAISSSSANKRANAASKGLDEAVAYARANPSAFGEKLDWSGVDYSPMFKSDPGYGNIAGSTIAGNQRNLPANLNLMRETNQAITKDSMDRINTLYPGFAAAVGQQSQNTQNFLRGQLPMEDQNMITSRRTEAQSLGGGGANAQQVAADLGLARMDLMNQGQAGMNNLVNMFNAVDPVNRRVNPQSMFVDVGQAISNSIQENQFGAQFAQSERNAELAFGMQPDPQKAGLLNLLAGRGGLQAANQPTSVAGAALTGGMNAGMAAYTRQADQTALQNLLQPQTPPMGYQQAVASFGAPSAAVNGFRNLSGGYDITGGQAGGVAAQGSLANSFIGPPDMRYNQASNKPWPKVY